MKLNILYEDTHLLVCYKPAGVPVQSADVGREDCVSILKNYLYEKQPGKEPYLGVVHRLDQPVEGALVFAKTPFAAKELSRQVTDGTMQKYYLALCKLSAADCGKCGKLVHSVDNVEKPVENPQIYEDYLLKNGKTNTSEIVSERTPGAKKARLEFWELGRKDGQKLVKIKLITGRHHQIRVQMAHHGSPLAGDTKYNPQSVENSNVDKSLAAGRGVALCAYRLELIHPKSGKLLQFEICPEHGLLKEAYEEFGKNS
ncbi:MAG: RluA family pseudouridine synthase [Lachnospiraceae bacterium]|nr:RluA family pseudouridine synthase [Lachnospiraceae bacterium]